MLAAAAANHADPQIEVTCDRCRAEGRAGTGEFADLADLLAFTPVPRRFHRADGWSPERQQTFILALAATGSQRQAAHAIGMWAYAAEALRRSPDSESFNLAKERALLIAEEDRTARLAGGLAEARARDRRPAYLRKAEPAPAPEPAEPQSSDPEADPRAEWFERILRNYVRKLCEERQARLEGRVAAADFALR